MTPNWLRSLAGAAAAALLLAGCDPAALRSSPPPAARPDLPDSGPVVGVPSQTSRDLGAFYSRLQQTYLTHGLLRTGGGGPDTPFSQRQLVENFVKIALFGEFSLDAGRMVQRETASSLTRWRGPVRLGLTFSDTVPLAQRQADRKSIGSYARRLSRLTGLDISLSDTDPNYHVFVISEDDRRAIGPRLRAINSEFDDASVNAVQGMSRATLCQVIAVYSAETGHYSHAVAIIRAEHPDLLRLSCIHEELAQGLGLPNDSPNARPSIFNDDEEFGLLTTHDEYLLRMLYDPRMRPGMTPDQARPVAREIAAELLGGAT